MAARPIALHHHRAAQGLPACDLHAVQEAPPLDPRTRQMLDGEMPRLFTDEYRCPIFVDDLADALIELAQKPVFLKAPLRLASGWGEEAAWRNACVPGVPPKTGLGNWGRCCSDAADSS